MSSSDTWRLIILFILVVLSGFFSASETALMTLSKIRIRHMVDDNVKGGKTIKALVDNPSKLLGAILVGNNLVNIGATSLATVLAINIFGDESGAAFATGIMSFLILVFGEITPKSLATQNSERVSVFVAKPIKLVTFILGPIIHVMIFITNIFIRLLGGDPSKAKPFITEEELRTIVNVSHEEGILEVEEREMINNVFEFGDSHAKDVMTPRTDMVAISVDATFEEVIDLYKSEQFSRIPVYNESHDDIIGLLYIKDLIFFDHREEAFDIRTYMRQPFFTYEFKTTSELFKEMRSNRIPMAIVLDEYGGTSGILTLEDLVEEIVGEINDEYDDDEQDIEVIREDEYIVDASTKLDDLNEMLGLNLESENFDSIGGYVIGFVGRIPENDEVIEIENMKVTVLNVDKNRIEKLRIETF